MKDLWIQNYNATESQLFIDNQKRSLKRFLLHHDNLLGSVIQETLGDLEKPW